MTSGSHLHNGIWNNFFSQYRSKISIDEKTYWVDPRGSLPLSNAFYEDQSFVEDVQKNRLSIDKLVSRNSISTDVASHGPQPPAAPGPFVKTYNDVFKNQKNLIKILTNAGLLDGHH
jgi:hypothetical protein